MAGTVKLVTTDGSEVSVTNRLPVSTTGYSLANTFTQLTAPGSTTGFATSERINHSMFVTVAAINTTVVVRVEVSPDNSVWANLDISNLNTTITANGTYIFTVPETAVGYIRLTFVSETGGTAATIDCKYLGY